MYNYFETMTNVYHVVNTQYFDKLQPLSHVIFIQEPPITSCLLLGTGRWQAPS